jgi:hypothetical protein
MPITSWRINFKSCRISTFNNIKKFAIVYVGAYNRYYLIFECFGKNNTDFIKEAANQVDYKQLDGKKLV